MKTIFVALLSTVLWSPAVFANTGDQAITVAVAESSPPNFWSRISGRRTSDKSVIQAELMMNSDQVAMGEFANADEKQAFKFEVSIGELKVLPAHYLFEHNFQRFD